MVTLSDPRWRLAAFVKTLDFMGWLLRQPMAVFVAVYKMLAVFVRPVIAAIHRRRMRQVPPMLSGTGS